MDMNSDAKPTYRWMEVDLENEEFPRNVMRVGRDLNGEDIYLGRATYSNDLLPAKVVPARKEAYVAFGNKEIKITKCEVMLIKADFDWRFARDGNVPDNAFKAGVTSSGETLYLGRVEHDKCVTPGKIHPSHGYCYYSFDGKELKSKKYECLITHFNFKSYGKKSYEWKELDLKTDAIPRNMLRVGRDLNAEDIYIGRATYNNDLLPVKVVPARREAYVAYGLKEIKIFKCEVLLVRVNFDWTWARDGHFPNDAFKAGITSTGENLYVGRVEHNKCVTPGKIHPSHQCCYYSYDGKELKASEYECLVIHNVTF